jgi:hypothetical protein
VRTSGVLALVMTSLACSPHPAPRRLTAGADAPPDIVAACELGAVRCSRCHPIDRVLLARVESPRHWALYVARMRRQPRSGISEEDARAITRCLVARSFGVAALEEDR